MTAGDGTSRFKGWTDCNVMNIADECILIFVE